MSEPQLFYKKTWTRYLPVFVWLLFAAMLIAIMARIFLGLAPLHAFMIFGISALLCILTGLFGVLVCLWGLMAGRKNITTDGLVTLGLAMIPVIISLLIVGPKNFMAPPIHDITTDVTDPPFFSFAPKDRTEQQNSLEYEGDQVAAIQKAVYPDIQPLITELAPEPAFVRCRKVAEQMGWNILVEDPEAGMIEAVDSTRIFNFKDDIAIRVQAHNRGSRIDIRSVSRDGKGDLGANANRIRRFMESYQQDLQG